MSAPAPSNSLPQESTLEVVTIVGVPESVTLGRDHPEIESTEISVRSYTVLKQLGDGMFGVVWLCDWHGALPSSALLSPVQCGDRAREEWRRLKHLVAVKKMKQIFTWEECMKFRELEILRTMPPHPNIISLYDFFLSTDELALCMVFDAMEGNLHHFIKARKGLKLAGGLVSTICRQIVGGLDHIHSSGYFHRDLKPENILITTIGLHEYVSVSPNAPPNAPPERDVIVIVKITDFGSARAIESNPRFTEYVSVRWYRAPEVLLLSRNYSAPVDMWALGTVLAEIVNLKPLFPGSGQVDQINKLTEILGDPGRDYGVDVDGTPLGGGPWSEGVKLAREVGFTFPQDPPQRLSTLFDAHVPHQLIRLILELLRYDPTKRLTSGQCLQHQYLTEVASRDDSIPVPSGLERSYVCSLASYYGLATPGASVDT
ncbi:Serine/threonine protein kinase [Pleurotus ostreatus]|nr:Serine/threonine protein kinase [Pleurotus ostreatus]